MLAASLGHDHVVELLIAACASAEARKDMRHALQRTLFLANRRDYSDQARINSSSPFLWSRT